MPVLIVQVIFTYLVIHIRCVYVYLMPLLIVQVIHKYSVIHIRCVCVYLMPLLIVQVICKYSVIDIRCVYVYLMPLLIVQVIHKYSVIDIRCVYVYLMPLLIVQVICILQVLGDWHQVCLCIPDATVDCAGNPQVPSDLHGVNEHSTQTRTDSLQPTNWRHPHISTQPLASCQGICTSLI